MPIQLFLDSAKKDKRHYALAQHKKSPICLFNNGQQLNTVQGGIA